MHVLTRTSLSKSLFLALSIVLCLSTSPFLTKAEAAPPANASWIPVPELSDEFNGTALDTSKWKTGLWYSVSGVGAFNDNNVSVSGGNLVIAAKKENYNGKAYTFGAVESKFDIPGINSYVEIRAKALDSSANVLSAIWMQSSPMTSASNPNPEIDIQETFDFNKMTSALHTWKVNPDFHMPYGSHKWNTGVNVSADYHVYGLERRDGKLRFYFDGQLAWETKPVDSSLVEMARHMVLSLEGHLGNPNDAFLPGTFQVDYVRTYYADNANVPADGSYKIMNRKSGKALQVPASSSADGMQLIQQAYGGGNHEKWMITKNPDGTFTIKNVNSLKNMDLSGGNTANGTPVIQSSVTNQTNQNWHLIPTGDGYYKILSSVSGKAAAVKDASVADGAKVIEWTYGTAQNDQWQIAIP